MKEKNQNQNPSLWQISAFIPAASLPFFEQVFDEVSSCLLAEEIKTEDNAGKWLLQGICEQYPDIGLFESGLALVALSHNLEVPQYTIFELENKDWRKENQKLFEPVRAGIYYIYGSHITTPPPPSLISLQIDASTAFGTGKHQTTKGCLMALDYLRKDTRFAPKKILDMGCGTGILGLAAAKTYKKPVLAIDIDEESVRVAEEVAKNNGLAKFFTAEVGDGYLKGTIAKGNKYDLIFANILAKPLTLMAKALNLHLNKGGVAILSGLLSTQEEWVLSAHLTVGLHLQKRIRINEWSTLIVNKT